jgi:hypothetical protein
VYMAVEIGAAHGIFCRASASFKVRISQFGNRHYCAIPLFLTSVPKRSLIRPFVARVLLNPLDNAHLDASIEEAMDG